VSVGEVVGCEDVLVWRGVVVGEVVKTIGVGCDRF
jgi:hypothetical protein